MSRRVVITGRGAVSPAGIGVAALWEAVREGRSTISREEVLELEGLPIAAVSARFREADLEHLRARHAETRANDAERLLWDVISQALSESGTNSALRTTLLTAHLPNSGFEGRDGASSYGAQLRRLHQQGVDDAAAQLRSYQSNPPFVRESIGTRLFADLTEQLGGELDVMSLHATCATGLRLVCEATRLIRLGRAERVIVAVVGRPVEALHVVGMARALALSRWDGDPSAASRPFDQQRSGFVLGEGAGALVIEAEDAACKRGATCLAEVRGWGLAMNTDNIMRTNFSQIVRVMNEALATSHLEPSQVDLVDAMGTASIIGDKEESRAIHRVFGETLDKLRVSAEKAVLGYSVQASGLLELIACIGSLTDGLVAPVPTCETQELDLELPVRRRAEPVDMNIVMKNSFGMGGHYGSLILARC